MTSDGKIEKRRGTCLFCDSAKLTLEHIWPAWIARYLYGLRERGRFKATRFLGPERMPTGSAYGSSELNHKARVVCAACNNGWMSVVEGVAAEVLKPLLRGQQLILDPADQLVLRTWILLRAMVLECGGSAPGAVPFYTELERRRFADQRSSESLCPIPGTYTWGFQYRSSQWAARSNVANCGIHMVSGGPRTHRVQVVTGFVGKLGFQIVVSRWPKGRRLEMQSPAVRLWSDALVLLWPSPTGDIAWPPGGVYLTDSRDEPFLDRFIKPGFPLERRGV